MEQFEAETPFTLRNASNASETTKLRREECLDGYLALGSSLDVIQLSIPFTFFTTLQIKNRTPNKFKGLTDLHMFPLIQEIVLGHTQGLAISLLLCPVSGELPFKQILGEVHRSINQAILSGKRTDKMRRMYLSSFSIRRIVHPEEWKFFSENFNNYLTKLFGNPKTFDYMTNKMWIGPEASSLEENTSAFYFIAKRLGQDRRIENKVELREMGPSYSEVNFNSLALISIAVHIAFDAYSDVGEFLMWDIKCVQDCLTKDASCTCSSQTFNAFLLPGVGNIRHDFMVSPLQRKDDVKFIQFYVRHGHQFHRHNSNCFKEPYVVTKLAEANTIILQEDIKVKSQRLVPILERLLKSYICVTEFMKQIHLPTALRCEIVIEIRSSAQATNGETLRQLYSAKNALSLGYTKAKYYCSKYGLVKPANIVLLPSEALKNWLELTILPCKNLLVAVTEPLLKNLKENLEKPLECRIEHAMHRSLKSPTDFLDVLCGEAVITLFILGELSDKWPVFIKRALNVISIKFTARGDIWKLNHIKFYKSKITCPDLDNTYVSEHLPVWIGVNNLQTFGPILTYFDNIRSLKPNSSRNEYTTAMADLASEFFRIICATTAKQGNDQKFVMDQPIDLKNLQRHLQLSPSKKEVISVLDFIEYIEKGNCKHKILTTLYECFSNVVASKQLKKIQNFKKSLESCINDEILHQKVGLYYDESISTVYVILPLCDFSKKVCKIYTDSFIWMSGKEVGMRGIHCSKIMAKTLPVFLEDHTISRKCGANFITIRQFFNLIYRSLDTNMKNDIEGCEPSCELKCVLLSALCT